MRWWVQWLFGSLAAGATLFLVGTGFYLLVNAIAPALFANPALFRPWPGWTRTYMVIHPFVYGGVFAAVFLGLRHQCAFPSGVRGGLLYGAGVFVVGSLPVYLLAFASFQISLEVILCWIAQSTTQYTLAGVALAFVCDLTRWPKLMTFNGFRERLSSDSADWLVLANWLEDRGDELAKGVRTVADNSCRVATDSPKEFFKSYMLEVSFFSSCRPFNWPNSSWFDVVWALAEAHVNADSAFARYLDSLEDKSRELDLTAFSFSLCPDCLSKYAALSFDPACTYSLNIMPLCSLVWPDEHPEEWHRECCDECKKSILGLAHARTELWRRRKLSDEYEEFWNQALRAIPNWPGFKRLTLDAQQRESLDGCADEVNEFFGAMAEHFSRVTFTDEGGGLTTFTASRDEDDRTTNE